MMSAPGTVISCEDEATFNTTVKEHPGGLTCVHFWAPWAKASVYMNEVLETAAKKYPHVTMIKIDAEELSEISEEYDITAVPTVVFLKNNKECDRLQTAVAADLVKLLEKHSTGVTASVPKGAVVEKDLNTRLGELVNKADVMLFMKGDRATPRCGFSRQTIEILNAENVDYETFDILEDNDVRQGLKTYSDWATYPQLYVKGELVGGIDIIKELIENGDFEEMVPKKEKPKATITPAAATTEERTHESYEYLVPIINKAPVVLFMKGSPDVPECGFSRQVISLLESENIIYETVNILVNPDVRADLKIYSQWPTFPQLYVEGELVGGLDILKEMQESGDFLDSIPDTCIRKE
ncbi:hypothetical protein SARC_01024 [Sphaeroforma arctica JP610]|uniref:Glutaredoxin-3 n=1 Tax=Sphaeroforma arctica JP610 TaxID=667725 RepID=A0A0L0GD66_9EUKA|nr:hypothetical protein SARC_01024 [Sphaeroforma arctica JP610]KNC86831.1 hypothetical protein SARC_01024 [Sphaeroforma arctica JP610]|eukprot:XP_014160733.1 hypothetical protein SARC_01024 [Sphaeroforma arctica JP610]